MMKISFNGLILIAQITQGKMIGRIMDGKKFTKFFCMYEKVDFDGCFEKLRNIIREGKLIRV